MSASGKKYKKAESQYDKDKIFTLEEALGLVKKLTFANFNESVDLAVKLGIDPKHSEQNVRGTVVLPHGTGKEVRVLAFAKGEKEKEAREAGAKFAGLEDIIEKIEGGWLDFDKVVATPDVMGQVGKLGKLLGPRGLMPNPKIGTVTFDIAKAVKEIMGGKQDFRTDKGGVVHLSVGRKSFEANDLFDNSKAFIKTLVKLKPDSSKGQYLKSVSVSSTMSPGIKVDTVQAANLS